MDVSLLVVAGVVWVSRRVGTWAGRWKKPASGVGVLLNVRRARREDEAGADDSRERDAVVVARSIVGVCGVMGS